MMVFGPKTRRASNGHPLTREEELRELKFVAWWLLGILAAAMVAVVMLLRSLPA